MTTESTSGPAVELAEVSKAYRTRDQEVLALREMSLAIDAGSFVEIRGASGSGKSTLLALVSGLATPTSGTVSVGGEPISTWPVARRAAFRAEHVGFVFQMFHLLPYLSVLDNVLLAAPGQVDQAVRERAEGLLEELGLQDRLRHRPAQLSAGERQRVALSRALLNHPSLLLADEPTGNLDDDNARLVVDHLVAFHARGGTVLLATHDHRISAAERAIHLEHGRITRDERVAATS